MDLTKLVVPLVADIKDYTEGLKDADNETAKRSKSMLDNLSGFSGKVAGVLAVGITAGVGALTTAIGIGIRTTNDWADALDSLSDTLGTTSQEGAALTVMAERIRYDR